jgi:cob(I)alamin adenosyltransferase
MDEQRLERIESKLDKLAEAVTSIARVEEKIYASTKRADRLEHRLDIMETEVDDLKSSVMSNSKTVAGVERFFWVAISAGASALVYILR